MTLFGTTLDGAQLTSLALLLCALVFWIVVLRRERDHAKWVRWTKEGQQARRDAGNEVKKEPTQPRQGPWG